ncbi:hypothetical protein N7462_007032 [Penicillium macrosclerotiorum]|uniref:uncharacterized protein n=1 Tax=Penicillium macrosclerotiorum TaxID=303699 RepID=UPI0025490114|nr:uncharacterized protein N7462_007032 [Penicillium macrosclerotiorum]KAJ5678788.1 hypothetical protein N7462_007032 [Penicillium macrosclerotiorum]
MTTDDFGRGPAKGYVEALEHRLQITENVLLTLLSQVSETQLGNVFPERLASKQEKRTAYAPLARIEKKGIEDWSQYPLDTARNIRIWQHACTDQGTPPSQRRPAEADYSSLAESHRGIKRKLPDESGYATGAIRARLPHSRSPEHHLDQRPESSTSISHGSAYDSQFLSSENPFEAERPRGALDGTSCDVASLQASMITPFEEGLPAQAGSSWNGAPSLHFQQRFLW